MAGDIGEIVTQAWEHMLRTSPDPFRNPFIFEDIDGRRRSTYRERLDRQPINYFGELIPRIVTVRYNLYALGKPIRRPNIP